MNAGIEKTLSPRQVRIIDATLREGNQAPGVNISLEAAVDIARLLDATGVDMIECGHAAVGPAEVQRIRAIADLGLSAPLLCHARARSEDIAAAAASGAEWIGIFCGINRISRVSRLRGKSSELVVDMIRRAVGEAKELGLKVRYTIEDGTRTPLDLVSEVFAAAIAEGADRVCYADTLGATEPKGFGAAINAIQREIPGTPIEIHVHDDRGFAMANVWAGIEAGAEWVSTSVNGLGERCGITDLALLLANLDLSGARPLRDGAALQRLSRYVGAVSRAPTDVRRPIVGTNAFTHTARLHSEAVLLTPLAYAVFEADRFGRQVAIAPPATPATLESSIVLPPVICATELRHHRAGPGWRHVMIDERFVADARQYCIVREIPPQSSPAEAHVDPHRHICDSVFMFLGKEAGMTGLQVEVMLDGKVRELQSPATLFIPAGALHSYRVLGGDGYYINHVAHGEYNNSLLDAEPAIPASEAAEITGSLGAHAHEIRNFLAEGSRLSLCSINDHMDLFETGVLDSLALLNLYSLLETLREAPLDFDTVNIESVRTVRRICTNFLDS